MKHFIFLITVFFTFFYHFPLCCEVLNITGGGNFSIEVGNKSGHHVPAVDFFRRFERVVRRLGHIEESSAGRPLLLILDENQPSGSCRFEHSRLHRRQVLKLPGDYQSLLNSSNIGRVLTSALIQSRLGNAPQEPLPEAALWIADGLWAEFVHREQSGRQLMRFTWLPELRNAVENGGKIHLNHRTLTAPENIRPDSAEWVFYCQKARLMLEVADKLGSGRSNLLKDYCFLLAGRQLSVEDCFDQTFCVAARRKIFTNLTPQEIIPEDEKTAGRSALDRMALKTLYSQYVPMTPAAVKRLFEQLCRITFKTDSGGVATDASITDLPFLVEKYESCTSLPGIKIFELNELTAIAPAQLRSEFFQMAFQLGQIGSASPAEISGSLKGLIKNVSRKLLELERVDAVLSAMEKNALPLLNGQRFFMHGNLRNAPLPKNIQSFMDTVERSLQR